MNASVSQEICTIQEITEKNDFHYRRNCRTFRHSKQIYAHNKLNEMHCNCLMRKLKELEKNRGENRLVAILRIIRRVYVDSLMMAQTNDRKLKTTASESSHFITLHSDYTLNWIYLLSTLEKSLEMENLWKLLAALN